MSIEIAILDSLVDDFESLEQIKKYLYFLGFNVQVNAIKTAINQLLDQNLIYIVESISDNEMIWYGLTEKGKDAWEKAGIRQRTVLCLGLKVAKVL